MNIQTMLLTVILCILFLFSCGDSATDTTDTTTETTTVTETTEMVTTDPNTIKATFVNFELGDAAHFMFKDDTGKEWDFGSCMATNYTFEAEDDNGPQGFGPNPELVGKKFTIKYETQQMPMYQDGPVGDVQVIVSVTMEG